MPVIVLVREYAHGTTATALGASVIGAARARSRR
jgi:hypothetical protein